MTYKHLIWDWNGTLFDDAWLCVEIVNELLKKRDLKETTIEQYQEHFEFPVENYYRKLGFDFSKESFEDLSDEFMANYNRNSNRCTLQSGAKRVLFKISKSGANQSILSAMKHDNLLELVESCGVKNFFTEIVGLDNTHARSKVMTGKQWIAKSKLKHSEVLFVGDTIHDYDVSKVMGVDCVLIPSGHNTRDRLQRKSVPVVRSLDDILNLL